MIFRSGRILFSQLYWVVDWKEMETVASIIMITKGTAALFCSLQLVLSIKYRGPMFVQVEEFQMES